MKCVVVDFDKCVSNAVCMGLAPEVFEVRDDGVLQQVRLADAGLSNLDVFAWVGGFSSAPNTSPPEQLVADPEQAKEQLKLLYVSCGNKDGLMRVSQGVHTYLKEKNVPPPARSFL